MNFNFPASPMVGDTYQVGNSPTYIYNGERWVIEYDTITEAPQQSTWVSGVGGVTINSGKTLSVASDYVLVDTTLLLEPPQSGSHGASITVSNKTYNRDGKLFVFGDLLLSDTSVTNHGVIKVDGGLVLDGETTIIGDGIII